MTAELTKKIGLAALAGFLFLNPTRASAGWAYRGHVHHHHGDHGDVALGVLGGILGGVVIDRILFPPRVAVRESYYPPPPPRDPYQEGYWEGYRYGLEHGRSERYEEGRRRGYQEGLDASRRTSRY